MHSPARVGSAPYWAPRLSERNSPGLGEEHPCSCVHRGGGVDALVRSGLRPLTCGDTVVAAHDSGDTVVRGIAQATPWRRCRLVFLRKASPLPPIPTQRAPRGLPGPLRSSRGNLQPNLLRSNVVDFLGRGNRAVGRSHRCRSRSRDGPGGCVSAPRPGCSAILPDGKRVSRACDMLARKRPETARAPSSQPPVLTRCRFLP